MMRACLLAAVAAAVPAGWAEARPALCDVTDEGRYPCEFRSLDRGGSFAVSAPGKPRYIVRVSAAGSATAFVVLHRTVPLAGPFRRGAAEPACWVSEVTAARICARARTR